MCRLLFLLAFAICMQTAVAQKKPDPPAAATAGLDSLFRRVLSVWKGPGFAVAIVRRNKLLYARGFGYRDKERKLPVTPNTLFAIGSCTKAFTASLIGRLAAAGKLDLDKPVREYFPELKFYNAEMNDRITLRDMMSHRTGLPRHDDSWYYFRTMSRDSLIKRIRFMEPFAGIREKWQYNNFMFMAQGVVAEKITGKSWENNLRTAFFEPLGMTRSNFSVLDLARDSNAATGYTLIDSGKKERLLKTDYFPIDAMGPAGGINSSVTDMSHWLQVWIHGGKFNGREIIPAAFAGEAISSQMISGAGLPDNDFRDVYFSTYGLAWMLSSYRGHYRVEHGGNIDGFSASTCFFPSDSVGIVVLCNQNNSLIPAIVRNLAADHMLGLKFIDWSNLMKRQQRKELIADTAEAVVIHKPGKMIRHEQKDYAGFFYHPAYGTVEVFSSKDSLFVRIGITNWWLKYNQYDWFDIIEKNKEGQIDNTDRGIHAEFRSDDGGRIIELQLPLEPSLKPLSFFRMATATETKADSLWFLQKQQNNQLPDP